MKKQSLSRAGAASALLLPLAVIVIALLLAFNSGGGEGDNSAKYRDYSFEPSGAGRQNTYAVYRERHAGAALA
ncbi:MAG: hypothetical protein LBG76_10255, partial [Treponema sp.]|nr:hypothetical protein [Treponema sp.]